MIYNAAQFLDMTFRPCPKTMAEADPLIHDYARALRLAVKEAERLREKNRALETLTQTLANHETERLRERIESLERQAAEFLRSPGDPHDH